MPAWPDYAKVIAGGNVHGQDSDVERTAFDDGYVRQELRYRGALATRQITAILDNDADWQRFITWAETNAHAYFDWPNPAAAGSIQRRVRGGVGGIEFTDRVDSGRRTWELTCVIEGPR